ncbi:ATP-binding protein [Microbacterium sp. ISL-103]|uniref:ATP-binding protein n=1 Tax=Microbacterium sp. ISL-103 TaxID=2819156 RepID=UPI001BE5CF96|nr:ATP-binding protein [Microbacterium sp. ISL-103]MBT2476025.1 ATP-binding protein [Microbacterium sp. ISL-103]
MYRLLGYRSDRFDLEIRIDASSDVCFSVLIGANGSGKSRLLGELARSASHEVEGQRIDDGDEPARVLAVSNMVMDAFPFVRRQDSGYRYLGLRQSSNSMTTGAIASSLGRFYVEILTSQNFDIDINRIAAKLALPVVSVALGRGHSASSISSRRGTTSAERLARELKEDGSIAAEAINYVDGRLGELASQIQPRRPLLMDESRVRRLIGDLAKTLAVDPPVVLEAMRRVYGLRFELQFGEQSNEPFEPSAGQSLLLSMILRIASAIHPNSLILIDEPEIGLHPEWQSSFIDLLRDSLPEARGCHFVIATHSPYVALAATTISMPDHNEALGVHSFINLPVEHRGMSIEMLIYQVFGARVIGNASVNTDLTTVIGWLSSGKTSRDGVVEAAVERLGAVAGSHTPTLNDVLREYRAVP